MKERVIIVDENDNIIGYKDRGTVVSPDIYRVSALWITNSKGDVLLAKRAKDKKNDPDRWGPAVAGTNDEGETYEQNMIKETEEEIGLNGATLEKGPKMRVRGEHNYHCQWFILTSDKDISEFHRQKDEVQEIKWFSKEEIKEKLKEKDFFVSTVDQWIHLFV